MATSLVGIIEHHITAVCLRPSSDAELFMSRTKYIELST